MLLDALLAAGAVVCAAQAVRAKRLFLSALWLAGLSALVAMILYAHGAREVAVIELSVGAGLVTVLFVFAISIAGEEAIGARAVIPTPLAWVLVIVSLVLLARMVVPSIGAGSPIAEPSFTSVLWQDRSLDVLVQIVLIFSGVLGVLGLLADARSRVEKRVAEQPPVREARPAQPRSPERPRPEEVHV